MLPVLLRADVLEDPDAFFQGIMEVVQSEAKGFAEERVLQPLRAAMYAASERAY